MKYILFAILILLTISLFVPIVPTRSEYMKYTGEGDWSRRVGLEWVTLKDIINHY